MDAAAPSAGVGSGPSGIGGWLVLPMLELFLTPLVGLAFLRTFPETLRYFNLLSGTQGAFVIFEFAFNSALLILTPIALLVLFFEKRARFPKVYIGWSLVTLAFQLLDLPVAYYAFKEYFDNSGEPFLDPETLHQLGKSLFSAVIWVPYMLRSRRVRNTFVR